MDKWFKAKYVLFPWRNYWLNNCYKSSTICSGLTSVYEQMNLGEDIMQGQTFQSLKLKDFCEEDVKELREHKLESCLRFHKVEQKLASYMEHRARRITLQ